MGPLSPKPPPQTVISAGLALPAVRKNVAGVPGTDTVLPQALMLTPPVRLNVCTRPGGVGLPPQRRLNVSTGASIVGPASGRSCAAAVSAAPNARGTSNAVVRM